MQDKVIIAQILKPQGIKGEVKVKALTDTDDELLNYKDVYIDDIFYKLLNIRVADCVYYVIKGVADRDAAEGFRNKYVSIKREDFAPIKKDAFLIVDIIGLTVFADEEEIGKIIEIRNANTDIFTVRGKDNKLVMFPFVKGLLIKMDIENGKMSIDKKRFLEVAVYED